jgi:hypothetical protein
MDRRTLILSSLAAAAAGPALAQEAASSPEAGDAPRPAPEGRRAYTKDEVIRAGSDFLGVAAEAIGGAIEKISGRYGDQPSAYIAGEEGAGAFAVGARYGKGLLYLKGQEQQPVTVYWQGPSVGWDVGGNGSRCFTLCYGLYDAKDIYRRFPGVDGAAYVVGGLGVNYQRADGMILAPIRAGVGLRAGVNAGYLAYSRKRQWLPF